MGSSSAGNTTIDELREARRGMQSIAVYIVECNDGTFYTGYTNDPERRLKEHNGGYGADYTAARTPVKLVYLQSFHTRGAAMRREAEIKQYSHEQKERLVGYDGDSP